MKKENKQLLTILLLTALVAFSVFLIFNQVGPLADEGVHHDQVRRFSELDFSLHQATTVIPGYHATLGVIAWMLEDNSVQSVRLYSTVLSCIVVILFYLTLNEINKKRNNGQLGHTNTTVKTLQFLSLPIILPLFTLIYTDMYSLLLVLTSVYAAIKKRYNLSGVFAALSIAVRQNNIIWLLFVFTFIYIQEHKFPTIRLQWTKKVMKRNVKEIKKHIPHIKEHFKKTMTFIIGIVLFMVFIIANGGFSIGVKDMHPSFSFHIGNIWFIFSTISLLFLPSVLQTLGATLKNRKIHLTLANGKVRPALANRKVHRTTANRKVCLTLAKTTFLTVCAFVVYMITFTNTHPWNQAHVTWWLRTKLLVFVHSQYIIKAAFFIPVAIGAYYIWSTELKQKEYYLLYPFTIVFLLPLWLIEQRYYIIPITLFMLFKENDSPFIEYTTLFLWTLASATLISGMAQLKFFI